MVHPAYLRERFQQAARRVLIQLGGASLSMNLTVAGTSRCDVPARETAGGIVAPLNAARTAQRAVPTRFRGSTHENFPGILSPSNIRKGRGPGEGFAGLPPCGLADNVANGSTK